MGNLKCPICDSEKANLKIVAKDYLMLKGHSDDFSVYFCNSCNNGFSFPFLTNSELNKYYPDDYNCYTSLKGFAGKIQRIKSSNDLKNIYKFLKSTSKEVFEVGSGSGFFLSLLKKKGVKVTGIEPSESGVKYANDNFGLVLENCFFEDYSTNKQYDMVIAFHVLEHFTDSVSALRKIKATIKENGFLYIKVPRLDSWAAKLYGKFWHGYDLPRHRFHFTRRGLIELLKKEGFEIVMFKGDYGPLDTVRAIQYFAEFSENKLLKYFFKIMNFSPYMLKLFASTGVEIAMTPFRSGRMSIVARKKT